MATHDPSMSSDEIRKANQKQILKIALILAIVTGIEFVLAFIWPESVSRFMLNILFIILTLVKAFYIVAEFMHLKGEIKTLAYSVLLPLVFIVWLLVVLWVEGQEMIDPFTI
ncbi:cytochrome C oxidase subunit IV family protein [Flammeovirgaceae bacterium SG7u.111]|nr:cytochrome C oxidase subunit IV family protein [Flammeovirgaceae bacterium SG7u.132]WPO33794.1 cytochrome C oxidase subunit IV family protein [Flammeovirgaceae bacterium SG7u.111]